MSRFWVPGGSGNWNATDTNNWSASSGGASGASVPTAADDVFFDGNSGVGTVTIITASGLCHNIDFTGFAGTITDSGFGNGFGATPALIVSGSFIGAATTTNSMTALIRFNSTTSETLTIGGMGFTNTRFEFNGSGGTWVLQDTIVSINVVDLLQGTFNTNGQTVNNNGGGFETFGNLIKTIILGASTYNCNAWSIIGSNTTVSAGSSTINVTGNFRGGGATYNNVVCNSTNGIQEIFDVNTFANLTITNGPFLTKCARFADNQVVTGTFTCNGDSLINRIFISANYSTPDGIGSQKTITAAIVSISNTDFQDIVGAGAGSWTGSSLGNALNNSGITFTTPVTRFWVDTNGGLWSVTSSWSATSGGSSGASVPLCHDTVVFDASSITSGGSTISADVPRMPGLDFSAVLNTPTFAFSGSYSDNIYNIFGSFILTGIGAITFANSSSFLFSGRSSFVFEPNGLTFNKSVGTIMVGGTLTMQSNFANGTGTSWTHLHGNLNANNHDMSVRKFISTNSNTRTVTMGSGQWLVDGSGIVWDISNAVGITVVPNTSTIKVINGASSITFAGGGKTWNNIWITGATNNAVIVTGSNTFNDFKVDSEPKTVQLTSLTTQTISSWTVVGSAGNLITVHSTIAASAASIVKTSGKVCSDYLDLKDVHVSGGATWKAGSHSVNNGNNTGWNFSSCVTIGGQFFMCFD